MAGGTIKDSTYVWHDRLHVFLFSGEKLEKDKHLELVVSHLSTDFTYTSNIYIYIYIYIYILYIYIYIYMYVYI